MWNALKNNETTHVCRPMICRSECLIIHCQQKTLKYRSLSTRCRPLITTKNGKARIARNYADNRQEIWKNVSWIGETKTNPQQSDEKAKMGRKRGSTSDPKHSRSSMTHNGCTVLSWACMTVSPIGPFIFIDHVVHDPNSRMNSEFYRFIRSANLQRHASKLIRWTFVMQQNNNLNHSANKTEDFISGKSGR